MIGISILHASSFYSAACLLLSRKSLIPYLIYFYLLMMTDDNVIFYSCMIFWRLEWSRVSQIDEHLLIQNDILDRGYCHIINY
jgi:hypothetical protein